MDAECTHDGSLKHIQKFDNWGWETLERRVLDVKRIDSLHHLQVIIEPLIKSLVYLIYFIEFLFIRQM